MPTIRFESLTGVVVLLSVELKNISRFICVVDELSGGTAGGASLPLLPLVCATVPFGVVVVVFGVLPKTEITII